MDAIFRALAKGKREVTYPYGIAAGYFVKALAPGFMRRQVRRVTLDATHAVSPGPLNLLMDVQSNE